MTEKRIRELEDRLTETSQTEIQRERRKQQDMKELGDNIKGTTYE